MAIEEEEKPKAFKVDDRRRFSAEGELKPESHAEATRSSEPSMEAPHGPSTPRMDAAPKLAPEASHAGHDHGPGQLTFATFMVGLSSQALIHLGEIPDPHSGQVEGDLNAAEQMIDIIAMLHDKTRGNLDADEAQLVETVLFELRMKYVERARQAPH